MSIDSGRKVAVGLGRETTRGTTVAPAYWLPLIENDFKQTVEKSLNDSGLGVLNKHNAADVMKEIATGTISGKVQDRSFGLLLCAAFGAAPTSAQQGTSGVYDHNFAESQSNTPASLTVALKDGNRDERYALGMLRSLELSCEVGDWVKFSADLIAKKPASATNTVAYVAENEFKAKHVSVKLADDVAGLAGADPIPVKSFRISLDRGVEEYMTVGITDPYDIFSKEFDITGDFVMLYDGNTHRDKYLDNSYQAFEISIENTDVTIGSGSAHPKLVLTFPRVNLSEWGLDSGLGSMIEQTAGLQALYSASDGKTWSGVLTNTEDAY